MTHNMKLHPLPFSQIAAGSKTIELRLYDEKRRKIQPGDHIIFTNTDTQQTLTATVAALHCFETFAALYRSLPLLRCGYTSKNISTASPTDMEAYYSPAEQQQHGVIGIELEQIQLNSSP